jgi:cell division transport system permease protein
MRLATYFERHAQTLVGSLGRIVQQPFASLMTMGVIAIALALPVCLYVFVDNARQASGGWGEAIDLSVYLKKGSTDARAQSIAAKLKARGDVANVRVITEQQALDEFRARSGFGTALDALSENPLPQSLNVTPAISAASADAAERLKSDIAAMPDVDTVQLDTEWVKRFRAILELARRVILLTGVLLLVGVALIVGNTIRLDIVNRRAEIEVMKLVGGTDAFARRPFLYSGLWYGLGGGALALIIVAIVLASLAKPAADLAALYGSAFHLRGLGVGPAAMLLAGAGALGWVGSWASATRHIRAIEPT